MRNITDPDSRLMPARGGGFVQGYNAQNVTSSDGLIIATALTQDTTDTAWYQPMTTAAQAAAALIAAHRPAGRAGDGQIGLVLADAGYLSEHNLTCDGPDRLIATGKRRHLEHAARNPGPEPPASAGPATQQMAARLKTEDGIAAYRHRGHIAETPHGHIKHDMRFRQLSLRGKRKPPPNGPSPAPSTTCSRPSPPATSPPAHSPHWPADPNHPTPAQAGQPSPHGHPIPRQPA